MWNRDIQSYKIRFSSDDAFKSFNDSIGKLQYSASSPSFSNFSEIFLRKRGERITDETEFPHFLDAACSIMNTRRNPAMQSPMANQSCAGSPNNSSNFIGEMLLCKNGTSSPWLFVLKSGGFLPWPHLVQ